MTVSPLQALRGRRSWIACGAIVGLAAGWTAGRTTGAVYTARAAIGFETTGAYLNQGREVAAAVAAVIALADLPGRVEQDAAVGVRNLSASPDTRDAIVIELRAAGDDAAIQAAAANVAREAVHLLREAAASRASGSPAPSGVPDWREIEARVAEQVPAPIRNVVRPWYEASLAPHPADAATPVGRRPAIGGLIAGIGIAIFCVFLDQTRRAGQVAGAPVDLRS
ncbi:MAG: hypothetical protein IT176_14700 [Acidobacteria bacterium]|nr:hypothetical protein [Acidobacteriota bacterium]